jgi:hypothetical protein
VYEACIQELTSASRLRTGVSATATHVELDLDDLVHALQAALKDIILPRSLDIDYFEMTEYREQQWTAGHGTEVSSRMN